MNTKKSQNQLFNFLKIIAIIMVIDDHTSTRINILSNIFPYNSFYMPLFVFISGYFYKKRTIISNVRHKIKKLFIPYLIWNIIAFIIALILDKTTQINWSKTISINKFLIHNILHGSVTSLNGASWFVIMLFWVSIIYNAIHYYLNETKKTDFFVTVLYVISGYLSIWLCIKGYNTKNDLWLFVLRTTFYLQFFHFGYIFKKYIENILNKKNKLIVCGLCIIINVFMICIYGNKINFYSTSGMNFFSVWYLPLITSITGILFYYEIMSLVSEKFKGNQITNFISRNTFVILESHLLFLNIPNFYVYFRHLSNKLLYPDFPLESFKASAWVRYNPNTRLIGFFCGLIGSLLVAYVIELFKHKYSKSK